MLAERVKEWTEEWKLAGLEEGRQEDLTALRGVLLRRLGERFGPLPDDVRQRIEAIDSIERLGDLLAESSIAPSFAVLGLG